MFCVINSSFFFRVVTVFLYYDNQPTYWWLLNSSYSTFLMFLCMFYMDGIFEKGCICYRLTYSVALKPYLHLICAKEQKGSHKFIDMQRSTTGASLPRSQNTKNKMKICMFVVGKQE